MALTLEINGVDRTNWLAAGSFSASVPLGGRATANAIIEDIGRGYTPVKNQSIVVKDGSTKRFAGIIWTVTERCHPGSNFAWTKQFTLRCLDYNYIADKRRATIEYEAGTQTLGGIVSDLVSNFASGEGLTLTNVATGPTILEKVSFNLDSLTECFNRLSTITAKYGDPYLWYIDFDKDLHFSQFSANPAPFSLTETSNNFADFEIETSLDGYRNVQHARTEWEIAPTLTESFTGNGVLIGFITSQPIVSTPSVTVNGVPKTIGELGVDNTGKDFYWIRDGFGIFNQDFATLTGSQTLEVEYVPPATNVVTASDSAEISANGTFEAVDEQKNVNDYDTLVAVAQGGLTQFGTVAIRPRFRTFTAGLEPGQRLTVNLTRHGINTSYLIESVGFRWRPARSDFLEYDVQCTSLPKAAPQRTAWMEKLVQMARIGSPPQQVTGTSGSGSAGGTGGWSESPSGSLNGSNTVFTLVSSPSPSASLILAVNGVILRPGTDFTVSGNTITVASAPSSTDWIRAWYDLGYLYNAEEPTETSPLGGIFTLAASPLSSTLIFAINGVVALNGTDYSVSGATVDLGTANEAADWELAWYAPAATAGYTYNETPSGSINGSNTAFTLAATPSGVMVARNGILQAEGLDYTRSGATLTFLTAPATGDWIRVWSKA